MLDRDHPVIEKLERDGEMETWEFFCPVCFDEAEYLYANGINEIFGCDNCIRKIEPWDVNENDYVVRF